jgi:hypothetical protein
MNRLQRLGLLVSAAVLAGCNGQDTGVTVTNLGPLAYVRFVHAVPDRGPITGRWVDKVENWVGTPTSGGALGISYRAVTPFQGVSAGSRHFRLFPATTNIDSTQMVLADVTSDLAANTYYTFLVTGYRTCNGASPAEQVVRITETHPTIGASQYALRVIAAAPGFTTNQDYFITATAAGALPATAQFANVPFSVDPAVLSARTWVSLPTAATQFVRGFNTGTATASLAAVSVAAPGTPTTVNTANPFPSTNVAGSALTAFVFPQQRNQTTCAVTGSVGSAFGVDVRPAVP